MPFEHQVMIECGDCDGTVRAEVRRLGDVETWTACPLCGADAVTVETWGEALPGW